MPKKGEQDAGAESTGARNTDVPDADAPDTAAEAAGPAPGSPEERFADLVDELVGTPGVTPPQGGSGFGRSALRYERRIFAMFVRGRLVLKLPARRVDALVAEGEGVRFDANKGTAMKEWLSLDPDSGVEWVKLAQEALGFARGGR